VFDSLEEYVKNNFDGMLAFGDVHGDYESFKRAHDYAKGENFFFLSLGDLVDRGHKPYETVMAMADIVAEGRGGFIVGNHDDKFYRYAKGAKVGFSRDSKQTLVDVGPEREAEFLKAYTTMIDSTAFSKFYHTFDNITFVHAASHPAIWETDPKIGKTEKSRFIVGETVNEIDEDGYPVRLYNWIEEIPAGKTVVVGHDRKPIRNVAITSPMTVPNKNGGKAIFLDTGCGKGGFLSGAVVMADKTKKFNIVTYMDFSQPEQKS